MSFKQTVFYHNYRRDLGAKKKTASDPLLTHSEKLPLSLFTTLPDTEEAQYIYFPDQITVSSDDSCSDYEDLVMVLSNSTNTSSMTQSEKFAFQKNSLKLLLQNYKKLHCFFNAKLLKFPRQTKQKSTYLKLRS